MRFAVADFPDPAGPWAMNPLVGFVTNAALIPSSTLLGRYIFSDIHVSPYTRTISYLDCDELVSVVWYDHNEVTLHNAANNSDHTDWLARPDQADDRLKESSPPARYGSCVRGRHLILDQL